MSKVYVFSDPHFHHKNMAIKRGFSDEYEMNNFIIKNWNELITKRDVVWILGDITMEKANYDILNKLNGLKNVVLGNHDLPKHCKILGNYVNKICGSYTKSGIIFTHIPIHESEMGRFKYNIHGHLHEKILNNPKYINVCCENIRYKPILLNSIIK